MVTLPTTIHCMTNKMNYDERIVKFVLSLGITLNYSGTSLFMGIVTVFITRLNGVDLELETLIVLVLIITASSMSLPHFPSASLVMLVIILTSVDIDPSNISLLFAVDWIL